jgi:GNAT superfamily N-acetyltransferase
MKIKVRDAIETDIPILTSIKGPTSEVIHSDRLRDAQNANFRYLVMTVDENVIGFACLVYQRPSYWSDANDKQCLPQIVDLQIEEAHRGRGYGSAFIYQLEKMAAEAGSNRLYLSVNSVSNPQAYALYLRLGYQPVQSKPYRKVWQFTDSRGNLHSGEDWVMDLVKEL